MFFIAQGKRSGTLGIGVEVVAPCKGKSKYLGFQLALAKSET